MMNSCQNSMKGILFAVVGFACFSTGDVVAKILAMQGYAATQISCFYAFCAIIGLLIFSKPLGGLRKTIKTKEKKLHLLRALLSAPTQALNFYAFSQIPLANAYAVIFLAPFLTAVFAIPLLQEKVSRTGWAVILTGFLGVMIAVRPDLNGFSLPVIAVLITAVFTALRNILVRKMGHRETPLSLAIYPATAIFLATLIPAVQHYQPMGLGMLSFVFVGGLLFGAGLLLTSLAFRQAAAFIIAPLHYSQILWGVILGLVFFSDLPDIWTIGGMILIVGSGLYLIFEQRK